MTLTPSQLYLATQWITMILSLHPMDCSSPIGDRSAVVGCYAFCWSGVQNQDRGAVRDYVIQHVPKSLLYLPKSNRQMVCILPPSVNWGKNRPGNRPENASVE